MPNRTIALVILLTVTVVTLLYLATGQWRANPNTQPPVAINPSPTPNQAHTVFALSPNPLSVSGAAPTQTLTVMIDTGENMVDGAQFRIVFDQWLVSNVKITPGNFLSSSSPLLNNVDNLKGTIDYAHSILPGETGKKGQGVLATITFTAILQTGKTTPFTFVQEKTMATATGVTGSVLKDATGTTIVGQ